MQIQQIKLLTWVGALGVGAYLGWEVFHFLDRRAELEQYISPDVLTRVLKDEVSEPAPPPDPRVAAADVTRIFREMEWSGKEEVIPVETPKATGPTTAPVIAIADLLEVRVIRQDSKPEDSVAYVAYTNQSLKALHPLLHELGIGDRLDGKFSDVTVDAIRVDGVRFAFDDPEREPEMVAIGEFDADRTRIVVVDSGGAIMPQKARLIGQNADYVPFNPKRTTLRRPNEYDIGSKSLEELNNDYSRILTEDVSYRAARDPSTGAAIGLQITKVRSNSLPAQHGISEGEILKSINGHQVKTVQGAISFVKQEAATTTVWEAVFVKQGREFTRTYRSP